MAPRCRKSIVDSSEVMSRAEMSSFDDAPSTSAELLDQFFDTETREGADKNLSFLARLNLVANTRTCPLCGTEMSLGFDRRLTDKFQWRCPRCRKGAAEDNESSKRLSVRQDTIFADSRISLKTIVHLVFMWTLDVSVKYSLVMSEVGITSRNTVNDWFGLLRDICQVYVENHQIPGKLHGIVELEESKYFDTSFSQLLNGPTTVEGRYICLLQRDTSEYRLFFVQNRDSGELLQILAENLEKNSTIVSEFWTGYGKMSKLQAEFDQKWPENGLKFVDLKDAAARLSLAQGVEGTWTELKKQLRARNSGSADTADFYLYEYLLRRRHFEKNMFGVMLQQIRERYPVPA